MGFHSKGGRRCIFPLAKSHLPSCSRHLSAVLPQQFIINGYFQAVHFRNPGYDSTLETITMAPMRRIKQGGQEGTWRTSSWGAGTSEAGLAAEPGRSAMTRVSLHAAWCHPDVTLMSPCQLHVNEHTRFPKLGASLIPKAIHGMAFLGRTPVLIQMFISWYLGVGGTARKHKTSGHTVTERGHWTQSLRS